MIKRYERIRCDFCRAKVKVKAKQHVEGDTTLFYVKCNRCSSVYPAYVEDNWVRSKKAEIEKLQEETWGKDSDMSPEKKIDRSKRILMMRQEVEHLSKQSLVEAKMHLFRRLGERVFFGGANGD